ncbi:hypothetical protein GGQ74_002338 [Desulfobaculum xiamenense]|uniref:Dolichyl-diphosphooligosaccharide--protein glycosyltransferase n=1 Tax=Desulfobaculum xiamenense TaxID=995050 RepID=A0A846QT78_9BACT|nr:STT3 domain-containing protein [Desulfobaculum xiamenense]NJB68665.1 hypothetical protein [Desulfobaculum xiamenense]
MAGDLGILRRCETVGLDESRPLLVLGWVLFLAYLCAVLYVQHWNTADNAANFAEEGRPLLRNLDGYYYLRLAREMNEGVYAPVDELRGAPRPYPPPLLAALTAWVHNGVGGSYEAAAYELPPMLAMSLALLLMLAGRMLGNAWTGLVAAFAAFCAEHWMIRAGPGFFDTDCLNPSLVLAAGLFLYGFVSERGRARWWHFGFMALTWTVLAAWWHAWVAPAAVAAVAYALTGHLPVHRFERGVKLIIAAAAVACVGFLALYLGGVVDTGPRMLLSAADHLRLVAGMDASSMPDVGRSVQELGTADMQDAGAAILGGWGAVCLALVGLIHLSVRRPLFVLCLLPCMALGAVSVFSSRFYIFATPVLALGYGHLAVSAARLFRMPQLAAVPGLRDAMLALAFVALLAPGMVRCATRWVGPAVNAGDVQGIRALASEMPAGGWVWSWWDYGYMIQNYAGLPTVCDGGRTGPGLLFATAYPLAQDDPGTAARWMRFIARHGEGGMDILAEVLGGRSGVLALVDEVFADPQGAPQAFARRGIPWGDDLREFLFPDIAVGVFLNGRTLDMAYWWDYFGRRAPRGIDPTGRGFVIDRQPLAELVPDRAAGRVRYAGRGDVEVGGMVDVRDGQVAVTETGQPGPVFIAVHDEKFGYFVSRRLFDSVALRLLFRPESTRGHFRAVSVRPGHGGAWRVIGEAS